MAETDSGSAGSMKELRKLLLYVVIAYGVLGLAAFNKAGTEGLDMAIESWTLSVMFVSLLGITISFILMIFSLDHTEFAKTFGISLGKLDKQVLNSLVAIALFALVMGPAFMLPVTLSHHISDQRKFAELQRDLTLISGEFTRRENARFEEGLRENIEEVKSGLATEVQRLETMTDPEIIKLQKKMITMYEEQILELQKNLDNYILGNDEADEQYKRSIELIKAYPDRE